MTEKPKGDYEVGRGKPPKHTQFRPGQSGNPKGRPKMATSMDDIYREINNLPVKITIGGRARTVTMGYAIILAVANRAANGDTKAARMHLKQTFDAEQRMTAELNRAPNILVVPATALSMAEWEEEYRKDMPTGTAERKMLEDR